MTTKNNIKQNHQTFAPKSKKLYVHEHRCIIVYVPTHKYLLPIGGAINLNIYRHFLYFPDVRYKLSLYKQVL